ncbi:hypothetical protein [Methylocucumis oryzae]|uniref:hypothetical protein n=1 Tax=Methylocucumis oryzae TaxID=1632867 RepID=UPI0012FEAEED|nr:hypothetical protein [Methylocucumis oryzae]
MTLSAHDALAYATYIAPTGATGCTDCHLNNSGSGYQPGILEAARSPLGVIEGLKAFLSSIKVETNTPPVLNAINSKWDITVGESALIIPLQVRDNEDDTFALHGTAPKGHTLSDIYSKNGLPTIDFKWLPTYDQANKTYAIKFYVRETGDKRSLKSNTVKAHIRVWPARTTNTKYIESFQLQGAQWLNNTLTLNGSVTFPSHLTSTQRQAALSTLTMSVTSAKGTEISQPVTLILNITGNWTKKFTLNASEVPCTVKVHYEGLIGMRSVSLAPEDTCLK